jgi:hypothetical protein
MASTVYYPEGRAEEIRPANGSHWELTELQTMVGGYIEVVRTRAGRYLVIDEDGKLKDKPLNRRATLLYLHGEFDPVC